MRSVACRGLVIGSMLEREMPMPVGEYVRSVRSRALEISEESGPEAGYEYYWGQVMGRVDLYRRPSEVRRALVMAQRRAPVDYVYLDGERIFVLEKGV